jgi:hypothetical protein
MNDYVSKLMVAYIVKNDPTWAIHFFCSNGRDELVEDIIKTNPGVSVEYARLVIKGRWEEAEKCISESHYDSRRYAQEVLKGRFPEYEKKIDKMPVEAVAYACVIKKRTPFAEKHIIKGSIENLFNYIRRVIKGRLLEAEEKIAKKPKWLFQYAEAINSKLPDELHAAMTMYSFSHPSDKNIKKYFAIYGK